MEWYNPKVYLTARDTGQRLTRLDNSVLVRPDAGVPVLRFGLETGHEITGFGAAFTEAAAHALSRVDPEKRAAVLHAYFDAEEGNNYSLCRTHINSCDFALGNYAYDDTPDDFELNDFDIRHDRQLLIPLIQDALEISRDGFRLLASPWSPPAWMKTTGLMNRGGQLRPACREAWARYYGRYIQAYAAEGIAIWGLTVQNEPDAVQAWDSCIYSAEEERDFVRDHLGPTLEKMGLGDVKLMIWDHNKDLIVERAATVLDDPVAARYIWGVGFHWYEGDYFDRLNQAVAAWPEKRFIATENCIEGGVKLGAWDTGERYGHGLIGDLNAGAVGWLDWNMALDEQGGPNHVGNYCDAPVIADGVGNEVVFESSYYYLGHFSRFIRPGARRMPLAEVPAGIEAVAFRNRDGVGVLVLMNASDKTVPCAWSGGDGGRQLSLPPHAIATISGV